MTRSAGILTAVLLLGAMLHGQAGLPQPQSSAGEIRLPSTKLLMQDAPGDPRRTNSFPANMALSPDGRYVAILNSGYGTEASGGKQSIAVLDLETNRLRDFPEERLRRRARQTYFLGVAFSSHGDELYASMASITDPEGSKPGDTGNGIAVYSFREGALQPTRFLKLGLLPLPRGKQTSAAGIKRYGQRLNPYPAGLAVIARAGGADLLLVANNLSDSAMLLDSGTGELLKTWELSRHAFIPATFPYAVVVEPGPEPKRAWVSLWNTAQIAELDLQSGKVARWISLGEAEPREASRSSAHATAMALSRDGRWLFVTLANRDRVAVVNTATGSFAGAFDVRLPGQRMNGSYPDAIAVSGDGRKLFVANAGNNAVAVFKVSRGEQAPRLEVAGFVPTQWYPSALVVRGNDLLVAAAKGVSTGPNAPRTRPSRGYTYIATLLYGSVARLSIAEVDSKLRQMTDAVLHGNRIAEAPVKLDFSASGHRQNPIRHVIYIIKENRTYDQVLGDLPAGDGDPELAIYGAGITPNQHQLALQFGVLDNFYDSGEVSGNGHVWSTAAITSDYTERTWQITYRGEERTYDYEGFVVHESPLKRGIPDVDEPGSGFLWANAARHGKSYRHYGEFVNTEWCLPSRSEVPTTTGQSVIKCERQGIHPGEDLPSPFHSTGTVNRFQWEIPLIARNTATKPELVGHFDPHFADFRLDFPDQFRADEFLREFDGFVAARAKNDTAKMLPQIVVLRLPDDHTAGTRPGMPTPVASVADNDLALGRVVEAISHSPYWDDTAILVLEDDAQNGPDHVDAHRSIAFVVSKYAPGSPAKPYVEHHFYTTVNMIRTIEDLVGLPPMNQNDAHAAPISELFSGAGTQPPFTADRRNLENGTIFKANAANAAGASESLKMDFSIADAADAAKLNAILWRDRKGETPMPEPKHAMIPEKEDKEDRD